jgi:hypothetical protein
LTDIEADVVEFDQEQFDRERAAWNAANVKDYSFNLYVTGYGMSSIIRFVVKNGAFKEREIVKSGKFENIDAGFTTIPAFYDKIERTVQDARKKYEGRNPNDIRFLIDVVYNTENHFPVSMRNSELDFNSTGLLLADTITCSIKDFKRGN